MTALLSCVLRSVVNREPRCRVGRWQNASDAMPAENQKVPGSSARNKTERHHATMVRTAFVDHASGVSLKVSAANGARPGGLLHLLFAR